MMRRVSSKILPGARLSSQLSATDVCKLSLEPVVPEEEKDLVLAQILPNSDKNYTTV